MKVEATIDSIMFETYETGDSRALLGFEHNEELKKLNFSYLSVPIDESITQMRKLTISRQDKVFMHFENNNLKYYELRRYSKNLTSLPAVCNVCGKPLRKVNTLEGKIKKIWCGNDAECNAHSRACLIRLFASAGVSYQHAILYMDKHYASRITHLWDLVLIYKQNNGDPNTEPRQKMWDNDNALWEVEKTLYNFLKNTDINIRTFWKIGFGIELERPTVRNPELKYPKVVADNWHLVEQLKLFFAEFKKPV